MGWSQLPVDWAFLSLPTSDPVWLFTSSDIRVRRMSVAARMRCSLRIDSACRLVPLLFAGAPRCAAGPVSKAGTRIAIGKARDSGRQPSWRALPQPGGTALTAVTCKEQIDEAGPGRHAGRRAEAEKELDYDRPAEAAPVRAIRAACARMTACGG
ncbi:MAG: hypothetical protein NVSMB55_27130 [Mycobacteriales bacterium]